MDQLRGNPAMSEEDLSGIQNEYLAEMAKIKKYLIGELIQIFSEMSNEILDENISFWEGNAGHKFEETLVPASNLINETLIEASALAASSCIKNFYKNRINLAVTDYKPSIN